MQPVFPAITRRYEKASTILTSNKSYSDWGTVFGDHVIVTAILDRLLHHSTTINIRGESYRLKEKRRAGLLKKNLRKERVNPKENLAGDNRSNFR